MESTPDSLKSLQNGSMIEDHAKPSAAAVDNEDSFTSMYSQNGEVSSKRDHGVPVIDLIALAKGSEQARLKIARQIARACETWGFFQLSNHGVDRGLLQRVQEVSLGFHKLPEEEKRKCQNLTSFPGGYFTRKLGETPTNNGPDFMFNCWSPPSLVAKIPDYLYPRNPRDYRQCRWHEDEWVSVEPIPDALVVNVGNQVEILSNGRYKSSLHRGVIHPTEERLSVAGFHALMRETVIGPLAELHSALYSTQPFNKYFEEFCRTGYDGRNHVLSRLLDS